MEIRVPKDMGSDLRVLPEDVYEATLTELFPGKSATGNAKITVKYTVTSEGENGPYEPSTIGETVLETFSLLEQAMFRLNDLFKQATGDRIPEGNYTEESFLAMLKEELIGKDFLLAVEVKTSPKGNDMTDVVNRTPVETTKKKKKK